MDSYIALRPDEDAAFWLAWPRIGSTTSCTTGGTTTGLPATGLLTTGLLAMRSSAPSPTDVVVP